MRHEGTGLAQPRLDLGRQLRGLEGRGSDFQSGHRSVGPAYGEHAVGKIYVAFRRFEQVGGNSGRFFDRFVASERDGGAADRHGPRIERAAPVGDDIGVALHVTDGRGIEPQPVADDLLENGFVPRPWLIVPMISVTVPDGSNRTLPDSGNGDEVFFTVLDMPSPRSLPRDAASARRSSNPV